MFTKQQIRNQLEAMQAPKDGIVLMHSSLRLIGAVEGGAKGLLNILVEYFTEEGGLFCVPTHTAKNYFLGKRITLDMTDLYTDPGVGAFARIALEDGRGIRSENPVLSLVVFGNREKAQAFIQEDAFITTPTAKESCYGKLDSENGHILLVGVDQTKNTYLHSVAELLDLPNRMDGVLHPMKVKRTSGEVVERSMQMYQCMGIPDVSKRFSKYDMAFRYHGCIKDGFIGNAPACFCSAAKMKDTVKLIWDNANGEDPLATEFSIPPALFFNKESSL